MGRWILAAISNVPICGGRTAALQMWWRSVAETVMVFRSSMVLSWKERKSSSDGTGMVLGVAVKMLLLSSSMGVACAPNPWRARSLTLWPGIGMPER